MTTVSSGVEATTGTPVLDVVQLQETVDFRVVVTGGTVKAGSATVLETEEMCSVQDSLMTSVTVTVAATVPSVHGETIKERSIFAAELGSKRALSIRMKIKV